MTGAILKIILGLFIWKIVPGWIEFGDGRMRSFIQLCVNIIGIIMVISGGLSFISSMGIGF